MSVPLYDGRSGVTGMAVFFGKRFGDKTLAAGPRTP